MNPSPEQSKSKVDAASNTLVINEMFLSLQGETTTAGIPTFFIRLTGCPLRCHYCDTAYAFHQGKKLTIDHILDELNQHTMKHITVTGGEPLAQKNTPLLLSKLSDLGYSVSIETSGAMPIQDLDQRIRIILDIKTPGSGETDKNLIANLNYLKPNDEIKFVLTNHADYVWANDFIINHKLENKLIFYSPAHGDLSATNLADWIVQDQPPVRLQLQLHKLLWGDVPGK